jgi:hypothetical protein
VPIWRDGAAGRELQKGMVEVARRRLFDYGCLEPCASSGKALFSNGASWAAFARLAGPPHYHIDAVLERAFDAKQLWSDSIKSLDRLSPCVDASQQQ